MATLNMLEDLGPSSGHRHWPDQKFEPRRLNTRPPWSKASILLHGHALCAEAARQRIQYVQALSETDGQHLSPINLTMDVMRRVELPILSWHNYELVPKRMKLTNTGHTVILSAKWNQERPFVSQGPLSGSYVLSQLHFHWGDTDREGSEHRIEGMSQPMEMHVVHFKSSYLTQESALREKDGICVFVYFFKVQSQPNPDLQIITDNLQFVQQPHTSSHLDPIPMSFLIRPFEDDYFLYWGSIMTNNCAHTIMWLVCREPIGVSSQQLAKFRTLKDLYNAPLTHNFRQVQPLNDRSVFHVLPSHDTTGVFLSTGNMRRRSSAGIRGRSGHDYTGVNNQRRSIHRQESHSRDRKGSRSRMEDVVDEEEKKRGSSSDLRQKTCSMEPRDSTEDAMDEEANKKKGSSDRPKNHSREPRDAWRPEDAMDEEANKKKGSSDQQKETCFSQPKESRIKTEDATDVEVRTRGNSDRHEAGDTNFTEQVAVNYRVSPWVPDECCIRRVWKDLSSSPAIVLSNQR
uniref:Alpha-carbonic anhydrase domain-containing protein n=1 Tax=Timema poppense TaxID=170557 RepID=A0A7R9DJH7_TIMPO|nr:unnamed protein product [Timema poppensis]